MNESGDAVGVDTLSPLRSYQSPAGYDEYLDGTGTVRPHWMPFASALDRLGSEELAQHWTQAERMVRETGMMYNPYGDPDAAARPWDLDAIPLLLSEAEWQDISKGLIQRARLLNEVLRDLYGPQLLLREGHLPAELVFANPAFVRAFHELPAGGKSYLQFYSADLARAHDGSWWVLADRSDAPLGAGYALENRLVLSRTFPHLFHGSQAERLAGFFIALRDKLQEVSPRLRENPRVVLLSQGPHSTNYFEDVYLARYLGLTLVEGGDLAVRDERVWLKTLGGLLPVDVIFRRTSEMHADPLELGGDAGCAGLLQAIRAGNVAVVNNLGCGLIESPAFMPFLPTLCERLFGEPLQMPSIATWWCGDPHVRRYVQEHAGNMVFLSAFRAGRQPTLGPDVLETVRANPQLLDARGHDIVGQARAQRSTAPTWQGGEVGPAFVALRTYLLAHDDIYTVMPGGLVRSARQAERLDRSILAGEGSKDVWVLAGRPVPRLSLLALSDQPLILRRSSSELPSRVAESFFWLGRYLERSEGTARLLRTALARIAGQWEAAIGSELPPLVRTLASFGAVPSETPIQAASDLSPQLNEFLLDSVLHDHPGSLLATLRELHRSASSVRDRLSIDSWQILNGIHRDVSLSQAASRRDPGLLLSVLNRAIVELSAMVGMINENTTRTLAWRFLDAGRRLERSLYTSTLVQSALVDVLDNEPPVLEAIVEVADSTMTYRSRYLHGWQTPAVLDLLLTDESNPRSLAYQLTKLQEHVARLPRSQEQAVRGPEQRMTISLLNAILLADVESLSATIKNGKRTELDRLLNRQVTQLPQLARLIANKYLVHAGKPRHMAVAPRGN